jgi:hypothetical protein
MPRALFLTRLYLLMENQHPTQSHKDTKNGKFLINGKGEETSDSGISVEPYFFEPIPKHYWLEPDFWAEIFRFWGSLVRVVLAGVGFEKPVFHYFD